MNKWIAAALLTAATSVATVSMAAPVAPAKPAPHVSKPVQHVLVKLRRTLLSENFHTPMGSSHCWLYAAV